MSEQAGAATAAAAPAAGPVAEEEVFLRAFIATPLVQKALELRRFVGCGAEASRIPRSLAALERRWFVGCAAVGPPAPRALRPLHSISMGCAAS